MSRVRSPASHLADEDDFLPSNIFPAGLTSSRGRKVKPRNWDADNAGDDYEPSEPLPPPTFARAAPIAAPTLPRQRRGGAAGWQAAASLQESSSEDTRSPEAEDDDDAAYLQSSAEKRLR